MRLDAQAHRLLFREISSMESLQHPNVIRLYEVVETPSRIFLVLEYAGRGDLHNRICTEGKLSDSASKITFAQILSAVKYMVSLRGSAGPAPERRQTELVIQESDLFLQRNRWIFVNCLLEPEP